MSHLNLIAEMGRKGTYQDWDIRLQKHRRIRAFVVWLPNAYSGTCTRTVVQHNTTHIVLWIWYILILYAYGNLLYVHNVIRMKENSFVAAEPVNAGECIIFICSCAVKCTIMVKWVLPSCYVFKQLFHQVFFSQQWSSLKIDIIMYVCINVVVQWHLENRRKVALTGTQRRKRETKLRIHYRNKNLSRCVLRTLHILMTYCSLSHLYQSVYIHADNYLFFNRIMNGKDRTRANYFLVTASWR